MMNDASQKNSADYSPAPTLPQALEIPQDYAGMRFDAALARLYPEHSRSRLQEWLKAGLIQLDGAAAEGKSRVLGASVSPFRRTWAASCKRTTMRLKTSH
jgi:23S rRNA pseudouridine1911/1915/1917 synthase